MQQAKFSKPYILQTIEHSHASREVELRVGIGEKARWGVHRTNEKLKSLQLKPPTPQTWQGNPFPALCTAVSGWGLSVVEGVEKVGVRGG